MAGVHAPTWSETHRLGVNSEVMRLRSASFVAFFGRRAVVAPNYAA